ncbi:MAG: AAA family ATPase [Chloroflexota bacterium]|nr:AAA family ATPase [Chloroflexota bacterium]
MVEGAFQHPDRTFVDRCEGMTKTIAVAGKGGTGKTSLSALLIYRLKDKGVVLAIDGDPSTNLHMALGLPLGDTVGDIREGMLAATKTGRLDPSLSKPDYVELKVREAVVESRRLDLLAMGRPEGPGCYCAANNMLRTSIDRLAKNYDYVVIDCEEGMEHISRQTTRDVNILLLVSDPTMKGITTAARMKELIGELRTKVGKIGLVVNRVNGGLSEPVRRAMEEAGLELLATIPEDRAVRDLDASGTPLTQLPLDSPLQLGVAEVIAKLEL